MLSRGRQVAGAKNQRGDKTSTFHAAVRNLATLEAANPEAFAAYEDMISRLAAAMLRMRR
jgi:hypothetical protein